MENSSMKFTICPVIVESERNVNIQKVEDYLKDFTEDLFRGYPELLPYKQELFIAGGCLRSLILGEPVKDVDIFIKNDKSKDEIKSDILIGGVVTDNAISFGVYSPLLRFVKTQIVITETGSPID